jgi:hypothetical protein
MKLEVGMYVRTKRKGIAKIDEIIDDGVITYEDDLGREWKEETGRKVIKYIGKDGWNSGLDGKEILKASYNIIDILEVGDIISFYEDIDNYKKQYVIGIPDLITLDNIKDKITNDNIRLVSILTKEQMEQMAYVLSHEEE